MGSSYQLTIAFVWCALRKVIYWLRAVCVRSDVASYSFVACAGFNPSSLVVPPIASAR